MSKKINFLYTVCWYCLAWALIAAIPHEPFFQSVAYGMESARRWIKMLACMLVLNLLLIILWLNLRMTVTQLKRIRWIAKLLRDLSFVAVGELLYTWAHMNGAELRLNQGLAVLMLGLLVCLGAALSLGGTPAKKSSAVWKIAVLAAAVAGLGLWIPGMWGITLPALQIPGELFGHYVGQLSLTFITISVMSVLSEKSVVIYWENIAEAKLIKPLFGSFASYTLYSIAATVGAGISVCLNNHLGFAFFFGANILILILLTLTLVDVYFGREQKKTERASLLCETAAKYRKNHHTGETDESYLDIMQNLQYHLFQELENHNIPYVREVAELYGGYIECFDTAEGREIEKMLRRADIDIKPMMLHGLAQRIAQLERKHETVNALEKGRWKEDSALWEYLAKKENLDAFVADDAEKNRLLMITVTRLTLLVNDILGSSVPMYAPGIRQYYPQQRHTSLKVKKTHKYLVQFVNSHVAEKACGCNADAGAFVANLLWVAQSLRSFGDRRMQEMLDMHLAMVVFANHPLIAEELSKKQ